MAEAPKKDDKPAVTTADTTAGTRQRMGVRLAPVNNSDQPVLANYATVNVAPGIAFIDFGFIEPGLLAAIPRVAKQGGKLPQSVNGKLAVRVAMGYARTREASSADRVRARWSTRGEHGGQGEALNRIHAIGTKGANVFFAAAGNDTSFAGAAAGGTSSRKVAAWTRSAGSAKDSGDFDGGT